MNELDRIWKEAVVVLSEFYPSIWPEGLRKNTKTAFRVAGIPSWDSNAAPIGCKTRALSLDWPVQFVNCCWTCRFIIQIVLVSWLGNGNARDDHGLGVLYGFCKTLSVSEPVVSKVGCTARWGAVGFPRRRWEARGSSGASKWAPPSAFSYLRLKWP
jgi:hypothetical protein